MLWGGKYAHVSADFGKDSNSGKSIVYRRNGQQQFNFISVRRRKRKYNRFKIEFTQIKRIIVLFNDFNFFSLSLSENSVNCKFKFGQFFSKRAVNERGNINIPVKRIVKNMLNVSL